MEEKAFYKKNHMYRVFFLAQRAKGQSPQDLDVGSYLLVVVQMQDPGSCTNTSVALLPLLISSLIA